MSKVSIAVIGLHGFIGEHVLAAINSGKFDEKIQFPVKAVTRKVDAKSTDKIQYVHAPELSDPKLATELKGVDVLVELTTPTPEIFKNIEELIERVNPKLFIPSQFGTDLLQLGTYASGFLDFKTEHSENVRKLGVKVVDIITSLWATPGAYLYDWVGAVGITEEGINVIGDINQKLNICKLEDVGNVVLAVATFQQVANLPDVLHIASDTVTVKNIIDRYSVSKNKDLKVISEISAEQGRKILNDKLKAGFKEDDFYFYLQAIVAQGLDKGLYFSKLDNELLNPNESLWKWGKF